MSNPAHRHHSEPEENEAQMAALLDALITTLDDALERAMRHGLGDQVRGVVAKHLPPETRATAATVAAGKPNVADLDRVIELGNCAQFLDGHARRAQPGSANAKCAAHFRDIVRSEIDRIMGRVEA